MQTFKNLQKAKLRSRKHVEKLNAQDRHEQIPKENSYPVLENEQIQNFGSPWWFYLRIQKFVSFEIEWHSPSIKTNLRALHEVDHRSVVKTPEPQTQKHQARPKKEEFGMGRASGCFNDQ